MKHLHYDDVITIKTSFGKKPGVRFIMNYEVCRDDIILATGFSEHVFTGENHNPQKPPKLFFKRYFNYGENITN